MQVVEAWALLLQSAGALRDVEAFRYDLVDVSRQVLSWPHTHKAYALLVLLQPRSDPMFAPSPLPCKPLPVPCLSAGI